MNCNIHRLVRSLRDSGRVPYNPLSESERNSRDPIADNSAGIAPLRLLLSMVDQAKTVSMSTHVRTNTDESQYTYQ